MPAAAQGNSMLELIVVHNGLERFVRNRQRPAPPPAQRSRRVQLYDAVPVGPLRLATPMLAGQFAWMLPLAVLGAVLVLAPRRPRLAWRYGASGRWPMASSTAPPAASSTSTICRRSAPPLAALAGIGCIEAVAARPRLSRARPRRHRAVAGLHRRRRRSAGRRPGSAFPAWRCWPAPPPVARQAPAGGVIGGVALLVLPWPGR